MAVASFSFIVPEVLFLNPNIYYVHFVRNSSFPPDKWVAGPTPKYATAFIELNFSFSFIFHRL